ncbi:polysaccharide deacetylase family protein [Falsiroseomonas oryzae]|uniref:polysaccharide deacetylase family protein n=1 Tax=Falsiroseomonas oryzae TaxID=2766473 RepID=UPI0022EAC47E|nr:polysaccharide deacetylase family protein [Roseomonas sp. MO-31]
MTPPRDFVGYAGRTPDVTWPNGARLALVIVLNIEEGAEPSIPDGDPATELALTDGIAGEVAPGTRDLLAESLFEYGARAGVWRIWQEAEARGLALTLSCCGRALERNAPLAAAIRAHPRHEVQAHGYGFRRHWTLTEAEQEADVAQAVASLEATTGRRPLGWQSRYAPSLATRRILKRHGFLYDADFYAEDLPCWTTVYGAPHLMMPHSFVLNDNRLATAKLGTADDFLAQLAAAFRVLRDEARAATRMMVVSLHARVTGQPARFDALRRFLDLLGDAPEVWQATRLAAARHWMEKVPAP